MSDQEGSVHSARSYGSRGSNSLRSGAEASASPLPADDAESTPVPAPLHTSFVPTQDYHSPVDPRTKLFKESDFGQTVGGLLGDDVLRALHAYRQIEDLSVNAQHLQEVLNSNKNTLARQLRKAQLLHVRPAFVALHEAAADRRNRRIRLQKALGKMRHYREGKVFLSWKVKIQSKKTRQNKLKRALRRMQNSKLSAAYQTWLAFHNKHKRRRDTLKKAVLRMKYLKRSSAWNSWVHFVQYRKDCEAKIRLCLGRIWHRTQAAAVNRWKQYITERNAKEAKLHGVIGRLLNGKLARAFESWRFTIMRRARNRDIVYNCIQRIRKRELSRAFYSFQDHVIQVRRNEVKVSRALARMCKTMLAKAWNSWMSLVDGRRRRALLLEKAIRKLVNFKMSSAFNDWLQQVRERKERSYKKFTAAEWSRIEEDLEMLRQEARRLKLENQLLLKEKRSFLARDQEKEKLADMCRTLQDEVIALREMVADLEDKEKHAREVITKLKGLGPNDRDFLNRNRQLVKHASSFQTLVRGMKAEALKSGDRGVLMELDGLAMERVTFRDGEIEVEAVKHNDGHSQGKRRGSLSFDRRSGGTPTLESVASETSTVPRGRSAPQTYSQQRAVSFGEPDPLSGRKASMRAGGGRRIDRGELAGYQR
eukprot:Rmarinus@m.21873